MATWHMESKGLPRSAMVPPSKAYSINLTKSVGLGVRRTHPLHGTCMPWASQRGHSQRSSGRTLASDSVSAGTPAKSAVATATAAPPIAPAVAPSAAAVMPKMQHYHFVGNQGSVVQVFVTSAAGAATVDIKVLVSLTTLAGRSCAPQLQWAMFRSSMAKPSHPKDGLPEGSLSDPKSGYVRTQLVPVASSPGAWSLEFQIPSKLAPVHLAMTLVHKDLNFMERPARGHHFNVPIGMSAGEPSPAGPSLLVGPDYPASCSVNFAVFSRHASAMSLALVRLDAPTAAAGSPGPVKGTGYIEVALDPGVNKTGDMWHICLHGLKNLETLTYAWRADGNPTDPCGALYHSYFLLLDPYATLAVKVVLPEAAEKAAPKLPPKPSDGTALLGSLSAFTPKPFSWGDGARRPGRSLEQTVVMEVDLESFTNGPAAESEGVAPERRGKLLGLLDRLECIKTSGATAVLLSSLALSDSPAGEEQRHPLSLLAPDWRLAVGGPLAISDEVKQTVKALHEAGMEVLLQVEFSVTGEAADATAGRLQGFRGLDAALYYRKVGNNTVLNTGHPVVRQLVLESLRHWAAVYQIDGFCVTGAENLTQDSQGRVQDNPAMAEEIAHDPVLRGLKMIASIDERMASLLPRGGVRGFPHWAIWLQCNYRYAAMASAYLHKSETGRLSELATRVTGSPDMFDGQWEAALPGSLAAARRPSFGLNMLTQLGDKSLLQELDADENLERAEVLARTTLLMQFMSVGTPCFAASTVNRVGLHRFVASLCTIRQRYTTLVAPPFFDSPRQIQWLSAYGGEVDWQGTQTMAPANVMCVSLSAMNAVDSSVQALYMALNPYAESVVVSLPPPPPDCVWSRLVDSSQLPPLDIILDGSEVVTDKSDYAMAPWAGVLLEAVPAPPPVATVVAVVL